MTTMKPTMLPPDAPRPPADSISEASLLDVAKAVAGVGQAVDGSVVVMRGWASRAILIMLVACGFLGLAVAGIAWVVFRSYALAIRVEAIAAQVEQVSTEQGEAKKATEEVKQTVDAAKSADDARPSIEIAPAASSGGHKSAAVIVIKSARPKPTNSTSASAAAAPSEIRIPVQLPTSATAVAAPTAPIKNQ